MERFNQESWSNIICASLIWPLLYAAGILFLIGSFIFSGNMKKILTFELLRDSNRFAESVSSSPRNNYDSTTRRTEASIGQEVIRDIYQDRVREAVRSIPNEEGKPIHIIGIIPDKMVSSYETNKSVAENQNSIVRRI
jgi:hypothetical protein